jgi:hypothetical protein
MMMHMPWILVTLIIFLLLVAGAAFVTIRVMAGRATDDDHPH